MMTACRNLVRRFRSCSRGVAAIEFGLLAPVLLLLFALSIEMGRAYRAYGMMENGVSGIGRALASFPEYDQTARTTAPLLAAALLPPDWSGHFNLQVSSLTKNNNAMQSAFSHTLFGAAPAATATAPAAANFEQGEAIIQLEATYEYEPLFSMLPSYTFSTTYQVTPYFSRGYAWNSGTTADKYVR